MQICPNCNTENPDAHIFCHACGESLNPYEKEKICPNCSSSVEFDHSFCPFCGTKFDSSSTNDKSDGTSKSFCVCPNCLSSVEVTHDVCPICNTNLTNTNFTSESASITEREQNHKLHCPNCRSYKITPINETDINGGMTINYGKVSPVLISSSNKTFWVCSNCGNKFRNIQSLEEEIQKETKNLNLFSVLFYSLLAGISLLTLCAFALDLIVLFPIVVLGIIADILMLIFKLVFKKKIDKLEYELEYLQVTCFN